MRRPAVAAVVLLLAAPLTGCGGGDAPICQSIKDLEDSVAAARKVDVKSENGVQELKSALGTVKTNLDKVRSEAAKQYPDQVKALDNAYDDLRVALKDRLEGANERRHVAEAAVALGRAVQELGNDLENTC